MSAEWTLARDPEDKGQRCRSTVVPNRVTAYKGYKVTWTVRNQCAAPPPQRRVHIKFPHGSPLNPECEHPFFVKAGESKPHECRVLGGPGVHKYEAHGADDVLDPELEIREPTLGTDASPSASPTPSGTPTPAAR